MNDSFKKTLWSLASSNPDLQQAIIKAMGINGGGYSIPTGDITVSIFEDVEEDQRGKWIKAIDTARELKVKDLARMLGELRPAIILKEAQGEELKVHEKTLRDIDITALAVFTLIDWISNVVHTEGSQSHDN